MHVDMMLRCIMFRICANTVGDLRWSNKLTSSRGVSLPFTRHEQTQLAALHAGINRTHPHPYADLVSTKRLQVTTYSLQCNQGPNVVYSWLPLTEGC